MKSVRPLRESDKSEWNTLWNGYLDFYKVELPEVQKELTWMRLIDPDFNMYGFAAETGGGILGIAHYSFQNSTWAPNNYCYLEDLFVSPDSRGQGIGRSLIDAVKDVAITSKSSRLYWNTDSTNEVARKLYDTYLPASGKVQYRIPLFADMD